ncbi:MAG: BatA domain-containing protein [Planctomycetaceae bacterium]|nr:BatA domain-containing protein [Planctomycetaceae bacterium]
MSFTTFSLFLGGLTASGIPVVLHLLMRGKPKRIEFPALMFLQKHLETHRRNYRLKNILLLLFRMLVLILFGLALARPTVKLAEWFPTFNTSPSAGSFRNFVPRIAASLGSQEAPVAAAVVIDSSPRMDYVAENQTRLDAAKDFAQWFLTQLPQNSSIAVLSSEREPAVFQIDRLAAEDKIEHLTLSPQGRPVSEAVQDALVLLAESKEEQRELYIISDLTEPGWTNELSKSVHNRVDGMKSSKDLGIFVVDVSTENPVNSSVVRFSLVPEIITEKAPVRFDVELTHIGPAAAQTLELLLLGLDPEHPDSETVRSTKRVDFADGYSRSNVSFTLSGLPSGLETGKTFQGKIRFTVHDALQADDQCWFTVQVQKPWKLLLLAVPPVREHSLYLRQALATVPIETDTLPMSDLAGLTSKELEQYGGVVLLDPPALDAAVWKKLADYTAAGNGVGIFLGANADSLQTFNVPSATEVLGAKLVRQARSPDGDNFFTPGQGTSPVFTAFKQIRAANYAGGLNDLPWDALPVFRYWEFSDIAERADVAAVFSDSRPAILTQALGRGRTLTAATPVSELPDVWQNWNSLPRSEASWMFVLLSEGIGKYLSGAGDQRFNFRTGEAVVLRPDIAALPQSCLMGTPSGQSVRLTPDPVQREIRIPATTEPGNYRIRSGGAKESLDTGFSANIDGTAMSLTKIDKNVLDQYFGERNYRLVRSPQDAELGIARRRIGQELYAAVLVLLALCFAGEYILSNRFYGRSSV